MIEEKCRVPCSAGRYYATMHGEILDANGSRLDTYIVDGESRIWLEWIFGATEYKVAIVVLAAYGLLDMGEELWKDILPLYIDGVFTNTAPSNLTYRYSSVPFAWEGHPGIYRIPFFSKYGIDVEGNVINMATGLTLSWCVTKPNPIRNSTGGYQYTRAISVHGNSKIVFRHRLIALVFLEYPANFGQLTVNHKDCNPSNNLLDNLEWATYAQNNQHALDAGMRTNGTKPVLMKDLQTGEVKRFNTVAQCFRVTGVLSPSVIQYRLKNQEEEKVYSDYLLFKYDDGSDWPKVDIDPSKITRMREDIIGRNVFSGQTVIFTGIKNGAKLLGIEEGRISAQVRDNLLIPTAGWNFRYMVGGHGFPVFTARHLEIFRRNPRKYTDGVIVIDITTNEELFFVSRGEAARHFRIAAAYVFGLARNNLLYKARYRFSHFKIRENLTIVPLLSNE